MKGTLTIYRRELAGLFLTPLGWSLLFLALLLNGLYFTQYLELTGGNVDESLSYSLGQALPYWALLVLLPPLLTMRMISEEARNGMLEFLLTAPVRDSAIIIGKALALTSFLALLWSSNLVYGGLCQLLGTAPDWGRLWAGFGGAVLVSALFGAVGLVASSLTNTPILAAFLALIFNVLLISISYVGAWLGQRWPELAEAVINKTSIPNRLTSSFLRGALDSSDVVFFAAWTVVFLVLATRLLEARRWW